MGIPSASEMFGYWEGKPYRQPCGHMGYDGECDTCDAEGDSPDPWLVADERVNLNRQAETRAYRQSKFRKE